MISVEQIKAARALLDWTQDDLAFRSRLSKPMINTLERRLTNPRADSMTAIQKAMERAGIEFMDGDGVKRRQDALKSSIFEGEDALLRLYRDIHTTLSGTGQELLASGLSENLYRFAGGARLLDELEKRPKLGMTARCITVEGDHTFSEPGAQYRCIPEIFAPSTPTYVYDNKYALFLWGPPQKVVIIENAEIADSFRQQFINLWEVARPPAV